MFDHGLAHELRLAILTSQLQIAIQPQVNLNTLNMTGAEVLLRWQHPKLGFISADRWVEIAEMHGLMPQLNRWLIGQVTTLIKNNSHLSASLAINISPTSLDDALVQFLLQAIETNKINPKLIEIEITESATIENLSTTARCIRHLREKGVVVSLDDFGSGYASMRYLVELEVDKIKIDKSFIHKAENNSNARLVLRNMIGLGKEINLKILCEGIETQDQLNLVKSLGADEGQGYYFGKPQLLTEQIRTALNSQSSLLLAS